MEINEPTPQPEPEFVSARARRRRALRRAYFPADEAGRAALFEHLAQRAYPSYELFVFSLVAGVIIGVGYFVNSLALIFFGILVAPVLTPWIGLSLAAIAGSFRLFAQTFVALLLSAFLVFASGLLAGYASRIFGPLNFNEAFTLSRLWWPSFVILTIGSIIFTISFVRSETLPYLPSALISSVLFTPLCAAGFGLGSGVAAAELWPQGLLVFIVHFAWATFFAILTLFFLRFYPTTVRGASLTGLVIVTILVTTIFLTGFDQWIKIHMPIHFGTDGWRAVISDSFTFDNLRMVAQAIADAVAFRTLGQISKRRGLPKDRGRVRHTLSFRSFRGRSGARARRERIHCAAGQSDSPTPAISYAVKNNNAIAG
jgi:hypothetical protein